MGKEKQMTVGRKEKKECGTGALIWNRCWSFLPRISSVTVNKWSYKRKTQRLKG